MSTTASMTWLWYTISVAFLFIGSMSLILLIIVLKRRAQNGFWSRENHLKDFNHARKNKSSCKTSSHSRPLRIVGLLSCAKAHASEDDLIETHKGNFNLELKTCHIRNHQDRFVTTTPGVMHFDEYSTNSLYGTIDRLIVKKNNMNVYTTTGSHQQQHQSNQQQQQQQQQQQSLHFQPSTCSVLYTNNYNSITKDPKMINSHKSYVITNAENHCDDILDKNEIHF
jgi:hypothetical protein